MLFSLHACLFLESLKIFEVDRYKNIDRWVYLCYIKIKIDLIVD